jgi:hypothetical protein
MRRRHTFPRANCLSGIALARLMARLLDVVAVYRRALRAEAAYQELSGLCDAELERRGLDRQHALRIVFECLTAA